MARLYLVGRTVTLAMAAASLLLIWAAARKLIGHSGAAAAALLLAVTPLFTVNARYMTADVPMLFWLSLVLLFSVRILQGAVSRDYIYAGIALGLAAATRYQGVLGAFMIAAAHFMRPEAEGAHWRKFLNDRRLWIAAGVSLLVFLMCNPYIFIHSSQFWRELTSEAAGGTAGRANFLIAILRHAEAGLGVFLAASAIMALWMAMVRRDKTVTFILLGLGIPAILLLVGQPTMTRYLMPVLLLPVLLSAWAFDVLHRRGKEIGKKSTRRATPILLLVVLLFTGLQSSGFALLYSEPVCDTRTAAGEEVNKLPPGTAIGVVSDPWQFELPPVNAMKYRIVVLDPSLGAKALSQPGAPQYILTSDLQAPPLAARAVTGNEMEFWKAVQEGGAGYTKDWQVEVWPFGQKEFLRNGPQDMRYANPVIFMACRTGDRSTVDGTADDRR